MFILFEFVLQFGCLYVDMVKDLMFQNMKELWVQYYGFFICVCFVFDFLWKVIVLCVGNKDGMNEKCFYKEMIILVDREFS